MTACLCAWRTSLEDIRLYMSCAGILCNYPFSIVDRIDRLRIHENDEEIFGTKDVSRCLEHY